MTTQNTASDDLLREFPKLLKRGIRAGTLQLREEMPSRLRSEGAYIRALVVSRYGWLIPVLVLGLPSEAAHLARIHGASFSAIWMSTFNVATFTILLTAGALLIAYSLEFQSVRSQTVVWQRVSTQLIEIIGLESPCGADCILYAADATLRHLRHRRTYRISAVSAIVTAMTLWLGKDWLEKSVNHIAAGHGDVILIAVTLVFIGGYSIFHFPVWTLEGIRDTLHYNLERGVKSRWSAHPSLNRPHSPWSVSEISPTDARARTALIIGGISGRCSRAAAPKVLSVASTAAVSRARRTAARRATWSRSRAE